MKITVSENAKIIYITIERETEKAFSWEELQEIKDTYYPETEFIEVYPKKQNIINKGNVRHLFHVKKATIPSLKDVEVEMETRYYEKK